MTVERRTQAQRRAEAQQRLEQAAIAALVELGAHGASTTEICRRAGLSQGALFQHYPTKQDLLVAAVRRLYDGLREETLASLAVLPPEDRLMASLEALWRAFDRPEVVATLELYASSRTDEALRDRLSPMLAWHTAEVTRASLAVLPPAVLNHPDLDSVLALLFASLQSFARAATIEGSPPPDLHRHLRLLARILLSPPLSETPCDPSC